jgi:predicted nucleic acid-binding protein
VILVDTSVWIDHLRNGSPRLAALLTAGQVLGHPFVLGELALGNLRRRREVLALLADLPAAGVADHDEVLAFVERRALASGGIGWVDAHLLAAAALGGDSLWTLDRRLAALSEKLGVAA